MKTKNEIISELTILLADKTTIPVVDLKQLLDEAMKNYDIVELKTTLPSVGNGEATALLFKKFAEAKVSVGMKSKTLYQYGLAVRQLCETEQMDINLITADNIIHFLNSLRNRGVSAGTIRNKYLLLSSVFTFLFNHHYIANNPILETDTPKEHHKIKKPLSSREIEQVKVAAEKWSGIRGARILAVFYFMLDTGVRVSELCNIKISDVDFVHMSAVVCGKGDKERQVFFNEETAVRLAEYFPYRKSIKANNGQMMYATDTPLFSNLRDESKLGVAAVRHELKKVGIEAGVVRLLPHLLRATFATKLAKKGIGVEVIAHLLGHANLNTINRYILLATDDLRNAVKSA